MFRRLGGCFTARATATRDSRGDRARRGSSKRFSGSRQRTRAERAVARSFAFRDIKAHAVFFYCTGTARKGEEAGGEKVKNVSFARFVLFRLLQKAEAPANSPHHLHLFFFSYRQFLARASVATNPESNIETPQLRCGPTDPLNIRSRSASGRRYSTH